MEFMSRGGGRQPAQTPPQQPTVAQHVAHPAAGRKRKIDWSVRTLRYAVFIVLVGCALLLSTVSILLARSNNDQTSLQAKQVNSSQYQAVFLSNGQIYFGKITGLDGKAIVLDKVFYLHCNDTSTNCSSQSFTLYKLGVSEQLPGSEDKIIFNQTQVSFWENLKNDGKVATAIKSYAQNGGNTQQVQQNGTSQTPTTTTPTTTTPTKTTP